MRSIFILPLFLFAQLGISQDVMNSSPLSAPLEVNPTYTGNDTSSSARISYRLQWPQLAPGIHQTYVATSIYLPKPFMHVGVKYKYLYNGVTDMHEAMFFAAKYFKLTSNQELRVGLDVGYFQTQLDWNRIDFSDQVDSSGNGGIYLSQDVIRGGSAGGVQFNAGLSYHLYGFHLGVAAYHINQPNASYSLGQSPIPMRFSVTTGYTHDFSWGAAHFQQTGIHLLVNQQGAQSNVTMLICNKLDKKYMLNYALTTSGNLRKHSVQAGYTLKECTFGYSFDFYPSEHTKGLGGAHEFFLVYRFWKRESGKRIQHGSVWN